MNVMVVYVPHQTVKLSGQVYLKHLCPQNAELKHVGLSMFDFH